MFDFGSCKFCISRCKEATGRVVTWKMGVENSFTMESSFHGSTLVDDKQVEILPLLRVKVNIL